jgi:opacity protein-like surface antigen
MVASRIRVLAIFIFFAAVSSFAAVSPASAQGFISPLIGYDFGGDSGCPQVTNCEDKRLNIGVAVGTMGNILGFEEELADARNFFGSVPTESSSVITLMSNLMIVPALGPVHPYVLGGIGLMKTHVDFSTSTLVDTNNNNLAWDIGGGVAVFFSGHVGVRGDIRHFHSFQSMTIPLVGTPLGDARLTFGRASGALVFRF